MNVTSLSSCQNSATPRVGFICWIECVFSVTIHMKKLSEHTLLISCEAAFYDGMTGSCTLEEGMQAMGQSASSSVRVVSAQEAPRVCVTWPCH